MKNYTFTVLLALLIFSSCSNNGKKATTDEKKEVKKVSTETALVYQTVSTSSAVSWRASHLGGIQPRFGDIKLQNAKFTIDNGLLVNAKVVIDMKTILVKSFPEGDKQIVELTNHLLQPEIFNVEKHPTSTFELTSIKKSEGDFNSEVTGNLTMLEVTKSITFKINMGQND